MNEILYQIALFVVIVAGIALIFVLWRTYLILTDINDSTGVMRKRIRDFDRMVSNLESSFSSLTEVIKGLAGSMEKVKTAKDKITSFFETKEEKGNKNE